MEMHEPLGCIAIVCGTSHFPLLSFIVHAFGAIANGNSVVIVVDEQVPFPVMDLYEVGYCRRIEITGRIKLIYFFCFVFEKKGVRDI
jgi:hypothetical protein